MDKSIFLIEEQKKKEVAKFNIQSEKDLERNYLIGNKLNMTDDQKKSLANKIYCNLNNENHSLEIDEMKKIVLVCMHPNEIKSKLLHFELKYFEEEKKPMDLEEFKKQTISILQRYQSKAGGFRMEDIDWTLHTSNSDIYDMEENEILFENSINKCDYLDAETNSFLRLLIKRLSSLTDDIMVELRFVESEEDNLYWILLWCTHKNGEESYDKESYCCESYSEEFNSRKEES